MIRKYIQRFIPITLLPLLLLCTSCKQEIDLSAEYKDISFSYAILDRNDSCHYFKIYKGFLTDDNALVQAGDWNNIYYPVDSVEVRLEEYNGARVLLRSQVLDTTTMVPKEGGWFANPKQLLYYSNWVLDPSYTYRLVIHHQNTGEEVYAETPIVSRFSVRRPISSWNMNSDMPYFIQFYQAENAAAYDLYLTFAYIEVDKNTGAIEHKSFTKRLNSELIRTPSSTGEVTFSSFTPKDFYKYVSQYIEYNPNVTRYTDDIDGQPYHCMRLTVWAASSEFVYYKEVSTPSSSIVDNLLEYTNFVSENDNAYGLLASRSSAHINLMLDNTIGHNEDSLVYGYQTSHLNFDYYRNSPLFPVE
ncbi:MAG: hypothetical protein J6T59_07765 [Bacteroidales bacterium]|nr:hypothetical protein [Bacteroidales bacterium]MBO7646811.1 hypothetical protein [Bacteroidales bacterium]